MIVTAASEKRGKRGLRSGKRRSRRESARRHRTLFHPFAVDSDTHSEFATRCASKGFMKSEVLRAFVILYARGKLDRNVDTLVERLQRDRP